MTGLPTVALGQAVIAGSVTDSSGASMAGVTVAASSPALIEAIRSTVTDTTGRYRIENLRPGVYAVTFTLKGWRPHRADGVALTGSFTASVDAVLELGSLAETIIVTSEGPIVDVRSVTIAKRPLSGEVVKTLPTVRSYNALLALVPGVVTTANDIVTGTATTVVSDARRSSKRGAVAARRVERWQPARGEFRDELCRRHRRCGRSHLLGRERAGRV